MSNGDPKDYKTFIHDLYLKTFNNEFTMEREDHTSQSALQTARLTAQRRAIDRVLVASLLEYSPQVSEGDIWKQIF